MSAAKNPMSNDVRAAVQRLNDARLGLQEADMAVRDADNARREAERSFADARKRVGRAVRGLRHELQQPASTVASGALGYFDPNRSLREYVEFEDGENAYPTTEIDKIIKWLLTNARADAANDTP